MEKVHCNNASYFGAANSFHGFESNFMRIFSAEKFSRIYILKGGPGTGKSTLMKRFASDYEKSECSVTRILCSSDPHSLDGVIVEHKGRRVAVLDGTAPHTMDPSMPGAIDEIINLYDAFNMRGLVERIRDIELLNATKKKHYANAYAHLKLAGEVNSGIWHIISKYAYYDKAERLIEPILENESVKKHEGDYTTDFLVSAFGKNGYTRLDIPCIEKEYFSVVGDGFSEYFVLNIVLKKLHDLNVISRVMPSPLTKAMTDAILTDSSVIATDCIGSHVLETSSVFSALPCEYEYLKKVYKDILSFAEIEFKLASGAHMSLEKIYTTNMNFEYNESVSERMLRESKDYLF